ncbi:MAG: hypothetical protein M1823_003606 [Watsoniomyces obsoletus]|nr:MAG: hypothetical protein M1823_003606 [Watsoniomyces obsoletus]
MARGSGGRGNRGSHSHESSNTRGSRGRGRGGGSSGGPPSREVTVSKALSFILRHGAEKEGLKLDEKGYARVDELLSWHKLKKLNVTFTEIKSVVESNEKKRFTLIRNPASPFSSTTETSAPQAEDDDNPSNYLIRAAQGHSIPIDHSHLLTELTLETAPEYALHGTFSKTWPLIVKSGGLKKMGRTLIHCAPCSKLPPLPSASEGGFIASKMEDSAKSTKEASEVDNPSKDDEDAGLPQEEKEEDDKNKIISGLRQSAKIHIYISLRRSMKEGGLKWWRSDNNVLLTEGDLKRDGVLGTEFFEVVVDTSSSSLGKGSGVGGGVGSGGGKDGGGKDGGGKDGGGKDGGGKEGGVGKVLWRNGKAVS